MISTRFFCTFVSVLCVFMTSEACGVFAFDWQHASTPFVHSTSAQEAHTHTLALALLDDIHLPEVDALHHFMNREMSACESDKNAWFALQVHGVTDRYAGCRDCMHALGGTKVTDEEIMAHYQTLSVNANDVNAKLGVCVLFVDEEKKGVLLVALSLLSPLFLFSLTTLLLVLLVLSPPPPSLPSSPCPPPLFSSPPPPPPPCPPTRPLPLPLPLLPVLLRQVLRGFCRDMLQKACCQVDQHFIQQLRDWGKEDSRTYVVDDTQGQPVDDHQVDPNASLADIFRSAIEADKPMSMHQDITRDNPTAPSPISEANGVAVFTADQAEQQLSLLSESSSAKAKHGGVAQWFKSRKKREQYLKETGNKFRKIIDEKKNDPKLKEDFEYDQKNLFFGHAKCDAHADKPSVRGVADLHVHMFSGLAFGGTAIWGSHNISDESVALAPCGGNWDHGIAVGHEGDHKKRKDGYPTFVGWPRWDATSHQQVYYKWLRDASDPAKHGPRRLAMTVITPVHNALSCKVGVALGRIREKFLKEWEEAGYTKEQLCQNVPNLERQYRAAAELVQQNGNDEWLVLAKTPAECRTAVKEGKHCAMLSGGEAGNPCLDSESPVECVDRLHGQGVRMMALLHLRNNRFAGSGFHTTLVEKSYNAIKAYTDTMAEKNTNILRAITKFPRAVGSAVKVALKKYPFIHEDLYFSSTRSAKLQRNPVGLSKEGEELVRAMIKKRIIIDSAHLSAPSIERLFEIVTEPENKHYPFVRSHGNVHATGDHDDDHYRDEDGNEEHPRLGYEMKLDRLVELVQVGGVLGLRQKQVPFLTYAKSRVPNVCDGSVLSVAQSYEFIVREFGLPVLSATDFNGAADNSLPRFRKDNEPKIFEYEACGARHFKCWYRSVNSFDQLMNVNLISGSAKIIKNTFGACKLEQEEIKLQQQLQKELMGQKTGDAYDNKGLGSIDAVPYWTKDLAYVGADIDCPICLTHTAEQLIRTWERTEDDTRKAIKTPFDDSEVRAELFKAIGETMVGAKYAGPWDKPEFWHSEELLREHADDSMCRGEKKAEHQAEESPEESSEDSAKPTGSSDDSDVEQVLEHAKQVEKEAEEAVE
jgi:microsomal dipeptidase-like Zn-dependent dipeptidase